MMDNRWIYYKKQVDADRESENHTKNGAQKLFQINAGSHKN